MLDKFIIHVLKSFMGIFPAVHFTSDKKIVNYLLLLVSLGVSVLPKEELSALFTVINLSLYTQILRHKDWVKSN